MLNWPHTSPQQRQDQLVTHGHCQPLASGRDSEKTERGRSNWWKIPLLSLGSVFVFLRNADQDTEDSCGGMMENKLLT